MKRLVTLGLTGVLLGGGCAYFSPPASIPVVEDKVGSENVTSGDHRVGTLATVAQRRMVVISFKDGKFCAEPPPDAADQISATLSSALAGGTQSVNASAQLATAFATYAKQLFFRSQGLQLYRDGIFSLCNAYVNGAIDGETLEQKHDELLKVSERLIAAEIPFLANIKADIGGTPTPGTPPVLSVPPPPLSP